MASELELEPAPGYTTTEFWVTIGNEIFAAVAAMIALFGHQLPDTARAVVGAAAPLAAAIGAAWYAHSRSQVKAAAIHAKASHLASLMFSKQEQQRLALDRSRLDHDVSVAAAAAAVDKK